MDEYKQTLSRYFGKDIVEPPVKWEYFSGYETAECIMAVGIDKTYWEKQEDPRMQILQYLTDWDVIKQGGDWLMFETKEIKFPEIWKKYVDVYHDLVIDLETFLNKYPKENFYKDDMNGKDQVLGIADLYAVVYYNLTKEEYAERIKHYIMGPNNFMGKVDWEDKTWEYGGDDGSGQDFD